MGNGMQGSPLSQSPRARVIRWSLAALALALLGAGVAGHLALLSRPEPGTYAGPLLILDHIFDGALALSLLAICAAAGGFALERTPIALETPLEELLFSVAIGAAILALIYLAAGALGLLWPPVVLGVPALIGAVTFRRLRSLPAGLQEALASVRQRGGSQLASATALAVLAVVGVTLVVQAAPPPTDWDSLMYHLEVPRRFLEEGRIFAPADNLHVAFVGLVHMLYLPLLAAGSLSAPAMLSALFAVALGLAVFSLAERFLDGETASLSAAGLWASTSLLLVALTPRIDVTLAFYLTLATHAALAALVRRETRGCLGLSALLLGLSLGIKLQAGAYILAVAPLLAWAAYNRASSRGSAARSLGLVAALGTAAAAPWLLKTWLLVGNPFYPLLGAHRLQPWLAALYGSFAAPASVGRGIYQILRQARQPVDLWSLFLAPGRLTVEAEGVHYHLSWLLPLLILWPLFWRKRALSWLAAVGLLYLVLVIVPRGTTNLRYLIPALPPLTIAAVFIGLESLRAVVPDRWTSRIAVVLVLATLYPTATVMGYWLRKSDVLGNVAGSTSGQRYLEGGFAYYASLVEAVNQRVPRDGKVLLFFEARGLYFEPEVIQDNALTNWPLLAAWVRKERSCPVSAGITHVLVSDAAVNYYISRGADPELFKGELFPAFAERCLEPAYAGAGFGLYTLRDRGEGD